IGEVPFMVSFLPYANWAELAFQFIVNNSSAKKVDENLLFAIVGQSLDGNQLSEIEGRLNRSGIKVNLIKASMRVHLGKSFRRHVENKYARRKRIYRRNGDAEKGDRVMVRKQRCYGHS